MIRAALKNPRLIVVVALAVLLVGVTSYQQIPADLLPIFRTPAIQIVTFYPGMSPEMMERDIMSRLERWTGQSVGIEHQEAKAMQGVCVVKDFFREDISNEQAMAQVTSYAVSDMFYLPPGTVPPMVMPFDPTASVPLCLVTVSNPLMTEKELYDIAAVWQLENFGFGDAARRRLQDSRHRQAHLASDQARDSVALQVTEAYSRVQSRKQQIEAVATEIEAAHRALALNFDGISGAVLSPIEAQQAINAFVDARQEQRDTVISYNAAQR